MTNILMDTHTHTHLCKYYISVYNYEEYSIALYQNKVFDKNHGLIVQYCKYHNRFTTTLQGQEHKETKEFQHPSLIQF